MNIECQNERTNKCERGWLRMCYEWISTWMDEGNTKWINEYMTERMITLSEWLKHGWISGWMPGGGG